MDNAVLNSELIATKAGNITPNVSFYSTAWVPLLITVDSSTHHSGYPTAYSGFSTLHSG